MPPVPLIGSFHRYRRRKNRLLKFVYVPATSAAQIGFFSSFSDVAVCSTNEANKAGLKQSIIFRCLWFIYVGKVYNVVVNKNDSKSDSNCTCLAPWTMQQQIGLSLFFIIRLRRQNKYNFSQKHHVNKT